MRYVRVQGVKFARGQYLAYIPDLDEIVEGSTQALAEHEVYRRLEEAEGQRGFSIVWV